MLYRHGVVHEFHQTREGHALTSKWSKDKQLTGRCRGRSEVIPWVWTNGVSE